MAGTSGSWNNDPLSDFRYGLGTFAERIGSTLGVPETGLSELIAGGSTPNTQRQAYASDTGGWTGSYGVMPPSSPTAPTSPTNPYSPPSAPTAPPAPSQEDQLRNQYYSYLDQAAGMLPETQRNLEAQVGSLFSGSQSSINTAQQGSLSELETQKGKVAANKETSLRDLGQSMRNQLTAGSRYLGGIPGATNSTGANQYNAALMKEGNKNRANLMKQTNELQSNIDLQMNKVKQVAQDQMTQLESWKNTQLLQISQFIQQQRGQIDQAKAQYIYSKLQNIDAQASSFRNALTEWAMNNSTTLDQLKQKMASFTQGNPTQLMQPDMPQGIQLGPTTGQSTAEQVGSYWSPQKKQLPGGGF